MSSIDDLLYEPFSAPTSRDFYIRFFMRYYDWCPISDRAKAWFAKYYPRSYYLAHEYHHGWVIGFTGRHPNDMDMKTHVDAFQELRRESYIFSDLP